MGIGLKLAPSPRSMHPASMIYIGAMHRQVTGSALATG